MQFDGSSKHSIIWMIDPFETSLIHRAPLARAIKAIQKKDWSVIPFSVASPAGSSWTVPVSFRAGQNLQAYGLKQIARNVKKLKLRKVEKPAVEIRERTNKRILTKEVLSFAEKVSSPIIAVNTAKIFSRSPFKLGSFAENLMLYSQYPVLAVNSFSKVSGKVRTILFPTDFSRKSHAAFKSTLSLAKRLDAKIILAHIEIPFSIPFGLPEPSYEIEWAWKKSQERESHRANLKKGIIWQKEALEMGLKCEYQSSLAKGTIAEEVNDIVKRKRVDLVCLTSSRSAMMPNFIWGAFREILRTIEKPVLKF